MKIMSVALDDNPPPAVCTPEKHCKDFTNVFSGMIQACEAASASQGVVNRHRPEWQQGEGPVRQLVVDQLQAAGIDEAGFSWGLQRMPTDPR